MNNWLPRIAFLGIFGLLWVPMLLQVLPESRMPQVFQAKALKGYEAPKAMPEWSGKAWWETKNGSYQGEIEAGLNQNLRLRPLLVRLNNQVKFALFDRVNARYVLYGKEGYYYSRRDINAYLGKNFLGKNKIQKLMRRLACVQDTLRSQGTELLFVMAPSKARYLPEYIPAPLDGKQPEWGNTQYFLKWLRTYEVPHLDYGAYLAQIRDSAAYPVYAKGGYHWTAYGVYLAADTLLRKMEGLLQSPLPRLELTDMRYQVEPEKRDHDIGEAANLLFEQFEDTLAYPQVQAVWPKGEAEARPRVLTIGDSYYSDFISLELPQQSFQPDWQFWYYNRQIRTDTGMLAYQVSSIPSLSEELESWDVILLVITELNLGDQGWKFIDKAFEAYYPVGHPCRLE